ncbi:hypothetical protein BB559_000408 [Furculomyces boomerangus]|uniref:Glutaredoxin domain-containing protein n=1 Tax=Furculomyces boomerangus TaxID=61424 RepID=A0A2T9Z5F5_9FUNG|nr:hypothetical protein BB559_000408 [Furculomyces boomerangus]
MFTIIQKISFFSIFSKKNKESPTTDKQNPRNSKGDFQDKAPDSIRNRKNFFFRINRNGSKSKKTTTKIRNLRNLNENFTKVNKTYRKSLRISQYERHSSSQHNKIGSLLAQRKPQNENSIEEKTNLQSTLVTSNYPQKNNDNDSAVEIKNLDSNHIDDPEKGPEENFPILDNTYNGYQKASNDYEINDALYYEYRSGKSPGTNDSIQKINTTKVENNGSVEGYLKQHTDAEIYLESKKNYELFMKTQNPILESSNQNVESNKKFTTIQPYVYDRLASVGSYDNQRNESLVSPELPKLSIQINTSPKKNYSRSTKKIPTNYENKNELPRNSNSPKSSTSPVKNTRESRESSSSFVKPRRPKIMSQNPGRKIRLTSIINIPQSNLLDDNVQTNKSDGISGNEIVISSKNNFNLHHSNSTENLLNSIEKIPAKQTLENHNDISKKGSGLIGNIYEKRTDLKMKRNTSSAIRLSSVLSINTSSSHSNLNTLQTVEEQKSGSPQYIILKSSSGIIKNNNPLKENPTLKLGSHLVPSEQPIKVDENIDMEPTNEEFNKENSENMTVKCNNDDKSFKDEQVLDKNQVDEYSNLISTTTIVKTPSQTEELLDTFSLKSPSFVDKHELVNDSISNLENSMELLKKNTSFETSNQTKISNASTVVEEPQNSSTIEKVISDETINVEGRNEQDFDGKKIYNFGLDGNPRVQIYGSTVSGNKKYKMELRKLFKILSSNQIEYEFICIAANQKAKSYMKMKALGNMTIPQIYVDKEFKSFYSEFMAADTSSALVEWLGLDEEQYDF